MSDDAAAPPTKAKGTDVVLLGPPTPDGEGVRVLRARDERIEAGELRALKEGKPITGEVLSLKPREDNPRVCDVEASYTAPSAALDAGGGKKGPAQVATKTYRDNWDEVFGRSAAAKRPVSELN